MVLLGILLVLVSLVIVLLDVLLIMVLLVLREPLAWVDVMVVTAMYVNRLHICFGNFVYRMVVSVEFILIHFMDFSILEVVANFQGRPPSNGVSINDMAAKYEIIE